MDGCNGFESCDLLLGEFKEFKRAQIEHNARMHIAITDLHDFKSKTLASSKIIAFVVSSAISVAGILISVAIFLYQSHMRSG